MDEILLLVVRVVLKGVFNRDEYVRMIKES